MRKVIVSVFLVLSVSISLFGCIGCRADSLIEEVEEDVILLNEKLDELDRGLSELNKRALETNESRRDSPTQKDPILSEETINELAKDLSEVSKIMIEINEHLQTLTPEEREKFIKKFKEEAEKSGLPIIITEP